MSLTCSGLDGTLDEALPLLQEYSLMLQRGPVEDARNALNNDAH